MSKRWLIKICLVVIAILPLIWGTRLFSAEGPLSQKSGGPVSITSEKMVLQNLKDKIIFEGSVEIQNEDLVIESDHAEVFMKRSEQTFSLLPGENAEQQVSKIVASGNVRIKNGDQRAKAKKGVYDRVKEVIVLTGDPEVWEDGYHVKGKVITFFITEERTLVAESKVVIHNGPGQTPLPMR
ncbi:MAG: LptA/OstA family protein [Waddliaceae bacterium]